MGNIFIGLEVDGIRRKFFKRIIKKEIENEYKFLEVV